MKKLYSTSVKKQTKQKFTIEVNQSHLPNKMHLSAQISFPALVQEDKRKKKPKHKAKIYEED